MTYSRGRALIYYGLVRLEGYSHDVDALELLPDAEEILRVLRVGARRAYVLEVTGTPKAGKTSTLGLIHGFFKRAGFRVHTLRERAGDCPIPMKGHFFFNAWTTCTMLAEVLATHDTEVDLIILDRGFFDALIWLGLQRQRGQVSDDEAEVFTKFVLLDRWRSLVDLTVLMTAEPKIAMEREASGVLIPRKGSLMNEPALEAFNDEARKTASTHEKSFSLITLDTTDQTSAKGTALTLLQQLLPKIRQWAEQHIVVLPRQAVKNAFAATDSDAQARAFLHSAAGEQAWETLASQMKVMLRHEVETDDTLVQIVGCGILVHDDKVFLLTRTAKDEKAAYGLSTIWKGCHLTKDEDPRPMTLARVEAQVRARVLEEFHLRTELELEFLGLAWGEGSVPESRHMGALFLARVDDDSVAQSMEDKEFRKAGRGHILVGKFQSPQQIVKSLDSLDLEKWSKFAVENIGLREAQ